MNKLRLLRGAAQVLAVLAVVVFTASSAMAWPWSSPEELGQRASKISESDKLSKKEVVAVTVPSVAQQSVPVKETAHYVHSRFFSSNQLYHIQSMGSAEYVDRLGYWMFKDADGVLYRFNRSSTIGIKTSRPTVDIGERASVISSSDRGNVTNVTAGAVSTDGGTRILNVMRRYTHAETYNDVSYTVTSTQSATFVPLQNAHMYWIDGTLYMVNASSSVKMLREKPVANIGLRASKMSAADTVVYGATVSAGRTSYSGQTRILIVSQEYAHEETFQSVRYTIQTEINAVLVPEQNAHMCWIDNNLYRVHVGSYGVERLLEKPIIKIGERVSKIDYFDSRSFVEVIPFSLSSDNRSILVFVRHHYKHAETYQVKAYYIQSTEIARYSDIYKVWIVSVDGRIFAIAFDGDVVNAGPDVVIVKAPGNIKKPDVIVVKPGGEDPPVVVPGKKKTAPADSDPPVVVPDKKKKTAPADGDPPVVVPKKKKTAPADEEPPIVVPKKKKTAPADEEPPFVVPKKQKTAPVDDEPPVVIPGR